MSNKYIVKKKLFLTIFLSLLLLGSLCFVSTAQTKINIQIASSSSGGTLYPLGTAWAQLINQNSSMVKATAVATGGSTENLRLLGSGEADFGTGLGPEAVKYFNTDEKYKVLRAIWAYTYGGVQWVVTENSGIRTISDMKGKRISVGAPGSAGATYVTKMLEAHGLEADKDYIRETLTGRSATAALVDGNIDVFVFMAPIPLAYIQEVATRRHIRLIPVDKEAAEKYIENDPGFFLDKFSKDAYQNQENEEDILAINWKQYWMARSDVDPEVVYEATKALFDNLEQFHEAHASIRILTLDNALDGVSIPLHAGAVRYYREKGIDIPDELLPPEIQ